MRFYAAAAVLSGTAIASPYADADAGAQHFRDAAATPVRKIARQTEEPCAQISNAQASGEQTFDPDTAIACLRSVPLDSGNAPTQLLGLQTMVKFQSTLAYLEDPPEDYPYPAVDIKGGLNKISDSLQNGDYDNEYDFQSDIYDLINSAQDEHFNFYPDITQIFAFLRGNDLFSVSKDGQSLPEIYMDLDMPELGNPNSSNYSASPVTKINGQAVEDFLDGVQKIGNAQDRDANYNGIFPIVPLFSTGQIRSSTPPYFTQSNKYQGSSTEVTFKNGTSRKIDTLAASTQDFRGVTDGRSFFQKFCRPQIPTSSAILSSSYYPSASAFPSISGFPSSVSGFAAASEFPAASISILYSLFPSASAFASPSSLGVPPITTEVSYSAVPSQTAVPAPPAFPKPWALSSDFSVACYFPEDNEDLAVLSVPSFEPTSTTDFSDVVRQCLATSNEKGKKKLILDLRGNGGGIVFLAYDLFTQLFPSMQPWGTTNFRAFPLFNDIGKVVTDYYTVDDEGRPSLNTNFATIFNIDDELDSMNDEFDSWKDFYGPVHIHGDTFTNLVRYNLSDKYQTQDIGVSGYGNLTDIIPEQTFSPENIIMLQDGTCASTCAVFAEFMKSQAKVKSVVMGGRPKTGPMQGVGGVKGANVYTNDLLLAIIQSAFFREADTSEQVDLYREYYTEVSAMTYATLRAYLSPTIGHAARVNIRNNIRKGDETVTPLQFVYEAANCRLFYTPQMIVDQAKVWSAAYSANWGKGNDCVQGSTGQESAQPGTSYIHGPKVKSSSGGNEGSGGSGGSGGNGGGGGDGGGSGDGESAAGRTTIGLGSMAIGIFSLAFAFFML